MVPASTLTVGPNWSNSGQSWPQAGRSRAELVDAKSNLVGSGNEFVEFGRSSRFWSRLVEFSIGASLTDPGKIARECVLSLGACGPRLTDFDRSRPGLQEFAQGSCAARQSSNAHGFPPLTLRPRAAAPQTVRLASSPQTRAVPNKRRSTAATSPRHDTMLGVRRTVPPRPLSDADVDGEVGATRCADRVCVTGNGRAETGRAPTHTALGPRRTACNQGHLAEWSALANGQPPVATAHPHLGANSKQAPLRDRLASVCCTRLVEAYMRTCPACHACGTEAPVEGGDVSACPRQRRAPAEAPVGAEGANTSNAFLVHPEATGGGGAHAPPLPCARGGNGRRASQR